MQNYKDLKVWVKAHEFVLSVYTVTQNFPKEEVYGLTSQLRRAAVAIAANIAEGCGKKTQSDFANFLNISLGSANESDYYILLAKDLSYIKPDNFLSLSAHINEIKAMLINLITKVRQG